MCMSQSLHWECLGKSNNYFDLFQFYFCYYRFHFVSQLMHISSSVHINNTYWIMQTEHIHLPNLKYLVLYLSVWHSLSFVVILKCTLTSASSLSCCEYFVVKFVHVLMKCPFMYVSRLCAEIFSWILFPLY